MKLHLSEVWLELPACLAAKLPQEQTQRRHLWRCQDPRAMAED